MLKWYTQKLIIINDVDQISLWTIFYAIYYFCSSNRTSFIPFKFVISFDISAAFLFLISTSLRLLIAIFFLFSLDLSFITELPHYFFPFLFIQFNRNRNMVWGSEHGSEPLNPKCVVHVTPYHLPPPIILLKIIRLTIDDLFLHLRKQITALNPSKKNSLFLNNFASEHMQMLLTN